ncbi:hypothetical protein ACFYUR_19235 [Micromonospora haikouensis]|uniref:hypothetical protein n=1 Tax=Micromonospora haikouensis TaxID=686309 RepID=UPI0036C1364D
MTRQPFAHQDASGAAGALLAVFIDGHLIQHVDPSVDPDGSLTAARHPAWAEVLLTCINHPTVAAVDCLTCDPMED